MCKLHGYRYTCGHFLRYRLSRCRATFTKRRRRDNCNIAACLGECYLEIVSPSLCGPCLYDEFTRRWQARIDEAQTAYNEAFAREHSSQTWGTCGGDDYDDDDGDDDGDDGDDDDDDHDDPSLEGDEAEGEAIEAEIEYRKKVLDDLRADFDALSWKVRQTFPTQGRMAYPGLQVGSKAMGLSPLRREVRPEEVVLRGERVRRAGGHAAAAAAVGYSTFQSFFMDTYSVFGPLVEISAEHNGFWAEEASENRSKQPEGPTAELDADINADMNSAAAVVTDDHDPDGSYTAEYNAFDVSMDADQRDEATMFTQSAVAPPDYADAAAMAYGPEPAAIKSQRIPLVRPQLSAPSSEAAPP